MSTLTENGAVSIAPDNPLVDLFFKSLRDLPQERFNKMLESAWELSQLITLKLLFYIRWCRGGKGEKRMFRWGLLKLIEMGRSDVVVLNLAQIPVFGSWKDLLYLLETQIQKQVLEFYTDQIRKDLQACEDGQASISLAGKWLPSQQKSMDKSFGAAKLFRKTMKMSFREYRQACSKLRAKIDIVERKMCAGELTDIDYAKLPSLARLRYAKAFRQRDSERYTAYLEQVAEGKTKMNVKLLYPYQLIEKYLDNLSTVDYPDDATLDVMWNEMVKQTREMLRVAGANTQALGVADVSGSMKGIPMANSIALSLLWAELCEGPFSGHFYTFSENPTLIKLSPTASLRDKVKQIMRTVRIENTNLQALFEDLLQHAKMWQVTKEAYPKTIYLFTDGQFDQMTQNSNLTHLEVIRKKHTEAGYAMPQIVFWNLRGNTLDFPAGSGENGVAMVSGFSQSVLKLILNGAELSPFKMMLFAISGKEFDSIRGA